ncbi:Ff.00g018000.m01.CDS01 [Fusarium sp. VM40]|nr:Ff.00g018000.m01.CDS01 [Fusarium sp. VM40]
MSGSLAGSAAILANSSKLHAVIAGSGHLALKELKAKLDGVKFSATRGLMGNYEIQADSSFESRSPDASIKSEEKKHPWAPLSVHLPVIVATFAAPIIAIGVLELLYHILRDEGHLVQINGDTATLSYIIRIASTLIVFGIATMINNLDSTIVVFAPYSNLRFGSAPADRSILFHLLSVNPFLVMFKSLQRRQLGPALSNGATLIAGFLTIIVSGLWTPANSLISNQPSVAAVNNWDRTWFSNASYDGGAASGLNLIRFGGARTPTGIWKDVVVPKVSLSADFAVSDSVRRSANYSYDVLALQPSLNCTIISQDDISTRNMSYQVSAGRMGMYASATGTLITVQPPGIDRRCSNSSINGFANLTFGMELRTTDPRWIGKYFDLPQSTAGQVFVDCPSIGMVFGSVTRNITIEKDLTAMVCSQGIKQVPVRLTYSGNPALGKIDSMHTHGEYKSVQNGTSKVYTLGYKLEGFLDANLFSFPANLSAELYDSFFNHLLLRPKGYSRDDLSGLKNADKFVRAVTQDYNEYLRHVINRNFRAGKQSPIVNLLSATEDKSARSLSTHSMITGEFSAEVTHLIVDKASKLILQVLLGTMTVLSFIGFCLVKIKGTLPRDPCSIGSTMALLADSQICDPKSGIIPGAAQQMSESQSTRVFDGWIFSLGWWSSGASVAPSLAPEDTHVSDTARKLDSGRVITEIHGGKRFGVDVGKANG